MLDKHTAKHYIGGMKNKAAVELGRRGGRARARKLTPQQRSRVARKAARSRWAKKSTEKVGRLAS